jgi:hypothetical protein
MSSGNVTPERSSLARLLAAAATALLVIFAVQALSAASPPKLLDPVWQLRLTGGLISFGPLALIGFFLMPLASWFDPANRSIARHSRLVQRWGLLAVAGYLLLIPLQGVAVVQGLGEANRSVQRQKAEAQKRIDDLREAVEAAQSPQELQERFQAIKAPPIAADNISLPMPALRQKYLDSIKTVNQQLRQNKSGPAPGQLLQLAQDSLRILVSALAFALAFAAGTTPPGQADGLLSKGQQLSLLGDWQARIQQAAAAWQKWSLRRRRSR